jgi:hypothetical protein
MMHSQRLGLISEWPLRRLDRLVTMTVENFDASLSRLKSGSVNVSDSGAFPEPGAASVQLLFSDGSRLRADYWRIVKGEKAGVSSFDHRQQYGLPSPIDAIVHLQEELQDKTVTDARLDERTGDLLFRFTGGLEFQVFNFTGSEVWEIHFPNGTGEYSPYAR